MENKHYTLEQLEILFAEYLLTLDDEQSDEYYISERQLADEYTGRFFKWLKDRNAQ